MVERSLPRQRRTLSQQLCDQSIVQKQISNGVYTGGELTGGNVMCGKGGIERESTPGAMVIAMMVLERRQDEWKRLMAITTMRNS